MVEAPTTNTSNETSVKAKKARKPFVWTEQKRANFEKMRQKRAEQLAIKKKSKEDEKASFYSDKVHLERLVRIKNEMKELLLKLEPKQEPEAPKTAVVKPVHTEKKPELIQEPEEELEEEIVVPLVTKPIKKDPPNLYRYTSQNQHNQIPKPPIERKKFVLPTFNEEPPKKTTTFTYL